MTDEENKAPKSVKDVQANLERVVDSTNVAVEEINERIDGLDSKSDQILSALNGMSAQDHPSGMGKQPGAMEPGDIDLNAGSPAVSGEELDLDIPRVTDVDSPEFKQKAEYEAFMREKVKIHIQTTSEKDADQFFDVSVNGRSRTFFRGETCTVARYYVEGLAHAKPLHYENQKVIGLDGAEDYKYPVRSGLRYNFSVMHDPNPRGAAWLERLIAQK